MQIRPDSVDSLDVQQLLAEHVRDMHTHSPPESVHTLDLDALRGPAISFFTARSNHELLGCGALLALDSMHAEIKSMRTANAHRRRGVAAALLRHLLQHARDSGHRRVSLETGTPAAFAPARALYARFGFEPCAPFGAYTNDPYSVCMTLQL